MINLANYVNRNPRPEITIYQQVIIPPLWRMSALEEEFFYEKWLKNKRSRDSQSNLFF